jgi:hypothetical protein
MFQVDSSYNNLSILEMETFKFDNFVFLYGRYIVFS